jgi:DNA-binding response OmpR family regulator
MIMRTILIVDDEPRIRLVVRGALQEDDVRILEAATGHDAITQAQTERPDLVILDLGLPDMTGLAVCERLRDTTGAPILVLSARHSEDEKALLLDHGADDYVTKPFSMKELLARVNAHLRRVESHRQPDGSQTIEVGGLVIDPEQVQAFVDGRPVGLTPREFEMLHALARAEGKPVPRERVYREVWGYEMTRGDRSVDVFVRKVRQKLIAACPEVSYVQTHYGVGYRFEAAPAGSGAEAQV